MKKVLFPSILLCSLILGGCSIFDIFDDDKESLSAVEPDSCKDIPKLKWQIYSRGFTAKEALDLATKLTVAAKADATQLKSVVDVSAKIESELTSKLSQIINLNVKQESKVSEKFWEQDLTYRQSLCYLDTLRARKDLNSEEKSRVLNEILEFSKVRREYMFQYEKKTGLNQI